MYFWLCLSDLSSIQHGQVDLFASVQHGSAVWEGFRELRAPHGHVCTALLLAPQSVWRLPGEYDLTWYWWIFRSLTDELSSSVPLLQESIKPVLKGEGSGSEEQRDLERQVAASVLYHSVSISLALLSPFMPFLTEELWQRLLPYADSDGTSRSLCVQPYPKTSQLVRNKTKHYQSDNMQLYVRHKTTLFPLLLHLRSTGVFLRRKPTSLWYRKWSEWRGYWGPSASWQRKDLTVREPQDLLTYC